MLKIDVALLDSFSREIGCRPYPAHRLIYHRDVVIRELLEDQRTGCAFASYSTVFASSLAIGNDHTLFSPEYD